MTITCLCCGKPEVPIWNNEINQEMEERGLCFSCNFWHRYWLEKDRPDIVRVKGVHYVIGQEDPLFPTFMRGFGGRKFRFKMNDGRIIESTNVWHQGEIPEKWKDRLPDNAVQLAE